MPQISGMPQKRKRLFILATKDNKEHNILDKAFSQEKRERIEFSIERDLIKLSENFQSDKNRQFYEYGTASDFTVISKKITDEYSGDYTFLQDIVEDIQSIDESYFINDIEKWREVKLGRKIERVSKDGHSYIYSEGKMSFPDCLERPGRTIITGEGGSSPSRFKHVIEQNGVLRRLIPLELERLQMFPDNHTAGFTEHQRAFMMGNALVTGVVKKIGTQIIKDYLTKI